MAVAHPTGWLLKVLVIIPPTLGPIPCVGKYLGAVVRRGGRAVRGTAGDALLAGRLRAAGPGLVAALQAVVLVAAGRSADV